MAGKGFIFQSHSDSEKPFSCSPQSKVNVKGNWHDNVDSYPGMDIFIRIKESIKNGSQIENIKVDELGLKLHQQQGKPKPSEALKS